jgi:hypothetical protein
VAELSPSERRKLVHLLDRFERLEGEVADLRRSLSSLVEVVMRLRSDRSPQRL